MNSKKIVDPYFARESEKYTSPIPSREYILSLFKNPKRGLSRQKIATLLMLETIEQKEALRRRLRAMLRDGQLIFSRSKGYTTLKDSVFLKGKIISNKEGFGFVKPEDGSSDLFLSAYQMRQVFPDDRVLVRVITEGRRNRREAVIVEVLDRSTEKLVGIYSEENGAFTAKPLNTRIHHTIHLASSLQGNAKSGEIVLLEIIQQPSLQSPPRGRVLEVLGNQSKPGIETDIAIQTHQLSHQFSKAIDIELKKLSRQTQTNHATPRVDLRQLPFVTIDGEDSKDFDDAVYCEPKNKDWRLLVAIADVSYYVKPDTALDEEASLRGNSVYFPDQVIPMLPEVLSNDLCSLKPEVDRFCLVCEMTISNKGKLKTYDFYPATIRSRARLTYTEVSKYLDTEVNSHFSREVADSLLRLKSLYEALTEARKKRGAIDLNLPETQLVFDSSGKIKDIFPKQRGVAHRIIEECMLVANVSAARFLLDNKVPSLFRVHDVPPADKIADFKNFIKQFNLSFGSWFRFTPKPIDFANVLEKTETHSDNQTIQMMLLRTMSQAIYSPKNKGHFGLAYSEYTHFTSPIRRYSDLIVHRAIYYVLASKKELQPFYYDFKILEKLGSHCSVMERKADEATRDVIASLKCQFIKTYIGKTLKGKISHLTGFGFFVELETYQIEGLVHVESMQDDHYLFDAKTMILHGQRHNKSYRLGDKVCVQVARVDLESNQIDFQLCH